MKIYEKKLQLFILNSFKLYLMNEILARIFQSSLENLPRENLVPDIDSVNR